MKWTANRPTKAGERRRVMGYGDPFVDKIEQDEDIKEWIARFLDGTSSDWGTKDAAYKAMFKKLQQHITELEAAVRALLEKVQPVYSWLGEAGLHW